MKIGTRKSPLALAQAEEVRAKLLAAWPELAIELVPMSTRGDSITDRKLAEIGGKGLFTKEIEEALLDGRVDVAVHSMKDMPTVLPDGLVIGAMLEREDPRDVLVGQGVTSFDALPKGASFGTSSLRRASQVLMRRPDMVIVPLRGNVQTRLAKIGQGEAAATMLAKAGLNRLGLEAIPGVLLSVEECLPAIAQGAIGIECREGDARVMGLLAALSHPVTETAVNCERAFLRMLDGSCRTPIAGYAQVDGGKLHLRGLIAKPDGSAYHTVEMSGLANDADALGRAAGQELLDKAGKHFL